LGRYVSFQGVDAVTISKVVRLQQELGYKFTITDADVDLNELEQIAKARGVSVSTLTTRNQPTKEKRGSEHYYSTAVDITIEDPSVAKAKEFIEAATRVGFTGIGVYSTGQFHVDTREMPKGVVASWGEDRTNSTLPSYAKQAIANGLAKGPLTYASVASAQDPADSIPEGFSIAGLDGDITFDAPSVIRYTGPATSHYTEEDNFDYSSFFSNTNRVNINEQTGVSRANVLPGLSNVPEIPPSTSSQYDDLKIYAEALSDQRIRGFVDSVAARDIAAQEQQAVQAELNKNLTRSISPTTDTTIDNNSYVDELNTAPVPTQLQNPTTPNRVNINEQTGVSRATVPAATPSQASSNNGPTINYQQIAQEDAARVAAQQSVNSIPPGFEIAEEEIIFENPRVDISLPIVDRYITAPIAKSFGYIAGNVDTFITGGGSGSGGALCRWIKINCPKK